MRLGIGLGLNRIALGGGGGPAYSTGDFTAEGAYSVTDVSQNGSDYDITMTGPGGTDTGTFTVAELESGDMFNVVAPTYTESPTGTYTVDDGGGWFFNSDYLAPEDAEFTYSWRLDGATVGTGDTYTKSSSGEDYQLLELVVTPSQGDAAVVVIHAAAVVTLNPIRMIDQTRIDYTGAGATNPTVEDYCAVAISMYLPAGASSTLYPLEFNGGSYSDIIFRILSGRVNWLIRDEAGSTLIGAGRAPSGKDARGEQISLFLSSERGGTVEFRYRDATNPLHSESLSLTAGQQVAFNSNIQMGEASGNTSGFGEQYRMAFWTSGTAPTASATDIFNALFDSDALPKHHGPAEALLGVAKWDIRENAADVNALNNSGTFAGTTTLSLGSGYEDV